MAEPERTVITIRSGESRLDAVKRYCAEHGLELDSIERPLFVSAGYLANTKSLGVGYQRASSDPWSQPLDIDLGTVI